MRRRLVLAALLLAGCTGGVDPLSCAVDEDCGSGLACTRGRCTASFALCPALDATFTSVDQKLLKPSCGAQTTGCHTAADSLSLAGNDSAALVNVQSKVAKAFKLVAPGDPDHSFLVMKLRMLGGSPEYGAPMPPDHPGAVCAESLNAVAQWIAQGASQQ